MRINGWWLALGLLSLHDYIIYVQNFHYDFNWIQMMNVVLVFIGLGLAFKKDSPFTRNKSEVTK